MLATRNLRHIAASATCIRAATVSQPISATTLARGLPWSIASRSLSTPASATTANAVGKDGNTVQGKHYARDQWTNVTPHILDKVPRGLHRLPHHPVNIIAQRIAHYWKTSVPMTPAIQVFNDLPPVVTTVQNFDDLLFPRDHPGRSVHDSYYLNETHLLRTHTSAHQTQLLRSGATNFLVVADCYRRDEIDASHYPVFHQMEGFRSFPVESLRKEANPPPTAAKNAAQACHDPDHVAAVGRDLFTNLEGMCRFLFGDQVPLRWNDDYFPFTAPSWELEVEYNGKWMEVLGCGVVQQQIISCAPGNAVAAGEKPKVVGWAFGLGLERLAMVLFGIPDIRLFWSTDPRFLDQFRGVDPTDPKSLVQFKPFSSFPPCYKDMAFWLPAEGMHDNSLFDVVRDVAGDLAEHVELLDAFTHPKTGRTSKCFRITYRSMDRNVTNDEINAIQAKVRDAVASQLKVELR
ncbi:phenylalanyl-tRNA synthetase alpha subunit, mitochondrial [Blastocladiella emersonii ATCC 22665]|nr:phenylalanyl-tRNA synthetase alpha subunit, mitochondrial [Blastocladiella emersonii ATCC 22665]